LALHCHSSFVDGDTYSTARGKGKPTKPARNTKQPPDNIRKNAPQRPYLPLREAICALRALAASRDDSFQSEQQKKERAHLWVRPVCRMILIIFIFFVLRNTKKEYGYKDID
jgi:hypothetical protein